MPTTEGMAANDKRRRKLGKTSVNALLPGFGYTEIADEVPIKRLVPPQLRLSIVVVWKSLLLVQPAVLVTVTV